MSEQREEYLTRKQRYANHLQNECDIMLSRAFIQNMINTLLSQVDAWERILGISPRTSEIRKLYKEDNCP